MRPVQFTVAAALLAIGAFTASAQPVLSAKSGVIASIEGKVLIDGTEVLESSTHFPDVKEGGILRTEEGRAELMLPPGFMLRMGENSALKMVANRLIDTRVEMQAGSAVVEVDQTKPDFNVVIALKDGVVNLSKVGVYRFDCDPPRLKVFHGFATVDIGGQSVMVATGKMLTLSGTSASAEKFDVEQTDSLDNWSQHRAEAMAMANLSGAKYSNDSYGQSAGNTWSYNPYYGMYTYVPGMGTMCNPYYNLCYYSPSTAYRVLNNYGYGYGGTRGTSGNSASNTYTNMNGATGLNGGIGANSGTGATGGNVGGATGAIGGGGMSGGGHAGGGSIGGGGTGGHK